MIRIVQRWSLTLLMLFVLLVSLEFIAHATQLGWEGLTGDLATHRLFSDVASANWGIFLHMIAGAAITGLAPLQLIPGLRRRFPAIHRWSGRVLVGFAMVTGLGGLAYIVLNGTVGGAHMSIAFAIYGALVLLCAGQTLRHARARRFLDHRDWAVRLFFLSIASLLYRVHYGLWYATMGVTGTAGLEAGMTGWFDRINIWAFYVPYLLGVELVLWRQGRGLLTKRNEI